MLHVSCLFIYVTTRTTGTRRQQPGRERERLSRRNDKKLSGKRRSCFLYHCRQQPGAKYEKCKLPFRHWSRRRHRRWVVASTSKSNKLRFFNICFAPESAPAFSFVCMALGHDERHTQQLLIYSFFFLYFSTFSSEHVACQTCKHTYRGPLPTFLIRAHLSLAWKLISVLVLPPATEHS